LVLVVGLTGLYAWSLYEPERQYHRGWEAYRRGQYEQAVQTFSQVLDARPEHAWAFFARGRAHQRLGNLEEAKADYGRADQLVTDGRIKACLGYCWNCLGNHRAAWWYYEKAIEVGYTSAEVYNNLGYSYLEFTKPPPRLDKAQISLDLALELNHSFQEALHNRALLDLAK